MIGNVTWGRKTIRRVGRTLFGDRLGLVLFLGALAFYTLTWRVTFFINDSYAVANTLVGVADGTMYVDRVAYGPPSGATPGMHEFDGRLYGRNFGHVFVALPFLLGLEAASVVADPRVALAAAWSLLLLAFGDRIGALLGRRDQFAAVAALVAVVLFGANVAVARPLWGYWFEFVALQLSSMTAAGFVAVLLYRLVDGVHGRRAGLAAGVAVAFSSPVGFWATVPKRHSFTALFVVATMYTLYRSRKATSKSHFLAFRLLSYVWVGLMAWIHAPEGVILLAALGLVDVATARSNGPRQLLVVGTVLALTMVPVLVTNATISGDPLTVPRMLPAYEGPGTASDPGGGTFGGGESSGGGSGDWPGFAFLSIVMAFGNQLLKGIAHLSHPLDFYHTFIAWESPTKVLLGSAADRRELTVVQSMPLIGVLLSAPLAAYVKGRRGEKSAIEISRPNPARTVDAFALVYLIVLLLIYLPRLPLHTTMTVRYLHPLYPIGIYLVARLSIVRAVLQREFELLAQSYAGFVLIGGPLLLVVLHTVPAATNAPVQFHGIVALVSGVLVATWAVAATLRGGKERTGAVAIALAGAVTTLFVVFSAFIYFTDPSAFALPIGELIGDAIRLG